MTLSESTIENPTPARRWMARAGVLTSLLAVAALVTAGAADAATITHLAAGKNPFEGVVPDFTIFGAKFTHAWQKLLGGAWGLGFVFTAFSAIRSVVALARAKRGGYGVQVAEQTEDAKWAGIAFGALTMLGIVVGGIIAIFQ